MGCNGLRGQVLMREQESAPITVQFEHDGHDTRLLTGVWGPPCEAEATWRVQLEVFARVLDPHASSDHHDPERTTDPQVHIGDGAAGR